MPRPQDDAMCNKLRLRYRYCALWMTTLSFRAVAIAQRPAGTAE
jgi:hypothetical protein